MLYMPHIFVIHVNNYWNEGECLLIELDLFKFYANY